VKSAPPPTWLPWRFVTSVELEEPPAALVGLAPGLGLRLYPPTWSSAKARANAITCTKRSPALKKGVTVMPVLIEATPRPRANALPDDIRELVLHQKHGVTHEQFGRDVAGLVQAIKFAHKSAKGAPLPQVPWGWVGATAVSVMAMAYVGAYQLGVPVPWPWAPSPQPPVLTPTKDQLEKATPESVKRDQEATKAAAEAKRRAEH
jgi:hypothetical protein